MIKVITPSYFIYIIKVINVSYLIYIIKFKILYNSSYMIKVITPSYFVCMIKVITVSYLDSLPFYSLIRYILLSRRARAR